MNALARASEAILNLQSFLERTSVVDELYQLVQNLIHAQRLGDQDAQGINNYFDSCDWATPAVEILERFQEGGVEILVVDDRQLL